MTKTSKDAADWEVPWIHREQWLDMQQTVRDVCHQLAENRVVVMAYVEEIRALYNEIEAPQNRLCSKSCPLCEEVCCLRATVWYDRRDLLVYYLIFQSFPANQVSRSDAGVCSHLGSSGCRLPRLERPFLCTWYICAAQARILEMGEGSSTLLKEKIDRIKELRRKVGAHCQPF